MYPKSSVSPIDEGMRGRPIQVMDYNTITTQRPASTGGKIGHLLDSTGYSKCHISGALFVTKSKELNSYFIQ